MKKSDILFAFILGFCAVCFSGCKETEEIEVDVLQLPVRAMDLSMLPEIEKSNTWFYNSNGEQQPVLEIIKASGLTQFVFVYLLTLQQNILHFLRF